MSHFRTVIASLVTLAALVVVAPAAADTASDMTADLQEAALPGLSVTVTTPPAATAADVAAFDADPASSPPSLSLEAMLSPDPTVPQPVATVRFGKSSVVRLPGLIYSPGVADYESVEDAEMPIWRMAIMSAMRRRLAAGAQLAGVAMQPQFPNRAGGTEPDLYAAAPMSSAYPPAFPARTLTADQVKTDVLLALPAWAKGADVRVLDRARTGRVVEIRLALPALATLGIKLSELSSAAAYQHARLNSLGGGIVFTQIRVVDAVSARPLYTAAADPDWGQFFSWSAAVVRGFGRVTPPSATDAVSTASDLAGAATGAPTP
jgi:hypothetical protein